MGDMRLLLGGFLGYVAGLGAWLATRYYVSQCVTHDKACQNPEPGSPLRQTRGVISPLAAIVQAVLVLWGAYAWWQGPALSELIASLVVTSLLATVTLVDLSVRRIPNHLVLALLAWGLVQMVWLGQPSPLAAVLGLLAGGGLLLLIAVVGRGAMGAGDVKFAGALGAVLGFPLILHGLFYGIIAGGLAALVLLVTRRVGRKDYIAYGPYLALGAWIVWTRAFALGPWA
jgi:leader peptidase (prepilin peptidase)/N-methyltransferase